MRLIRALFLSIFLATACASLWGQSGGIFAYTLSGGSQIFAVNPTSGALTFLSNSGAGGESASVDPSGRFIYGAVTGRDGSGGIDARTIDPITGATTEIPGSLFAKGSISSVAVDPTGQFLYATGCDPRQPCGPAGGTIVVLALAVDADSGALTLIGTFPLGPRAKSPTSVAVDPSGQFVYVANFDTVCEPPFEPDPGCPPSMPVCACPPSGSVSMYRIDPATGALAPLPGSPLLLRPFSPNRTTGPRALIVEPSGQFLYVASFNGGPTAQGAVFAFRIDSITGGLAPVPGSPVPSTLAPVAVAVDPSGQFLYLGNFKGVGGFNPSVSGFGIDAITGGLTEVLGSPYAAASSGAVNAPNAVAVDPTGQFVYLTGGHCGDFCGGGVTGFTIDPDTGALTRIPGSPFYPESSGIVLVDLRPPIPPP